MSIMPSSSKPWLLQAVCRGMSLDLWYGPPEPEEDPAGYVEPPEQTRWREQRAVEICRTCPVQGQCLAEELRLPEHHQWGVRGGMTAAERCQLLRTTRVQAEGRFVSAMTATSAASLTRASRGVV